MRKTLPRRPRKPLDCRRTFLWRARAVTPRLTLGMAGSLRVGQHRTDGARIRRIDGALAPQLALPLGALLREDVAHVGAAALDAAAAAHLEPLGGAALGFHLRHDFPSLFSYDAGRSCSCAFFKAVWTLEASAITCVPRL